MNKKINTFETIEYLITSIKYFYENTKHHTPYTIHQTNLRLNLSKFLAFTLMLALFLNIGCSKQNEPITPEVKEYFAPKDANIKEEIKNFLIAADRFPTSVAYKSSTTTLEDKEPNEGAWLMEAAINAERYGSLEKDVIDTKTYVIEVENKVLPSGLLRMDADDIILKYNQLLSNIISDEINQKVSSLIDFQIIEILTDKTTIQVEVNFVYIVEPIVFDPETIVLPPNNSNDCQYTYPPSYTPIGIGSIYNFSLYPLTVFWPTNPYFSYDIGSLSYAYNQVAKSSTGFYTYPPVPTGTSLVQILGTPEFTPYTNVILLNHQELNIILGCRNLQNSGQWEAYSDVLTIYKNMIKIVQQNIQNNTNNSTQFQLVYGLISDSYSTGNSTAKPTKVSVEKLGYIHIADQ